MNILLYVNSFLPTVGGKEVVVHYLAREMQKAGNCVRVCGPSGWIKNQNRKNEYPVHRWPTLRGLFPETVGYGQLLLDISIWGCDVVHAHTTYPNGYIAALLKKKLKLPLVITPHGQDIHVIPELGFGHRLDPIKNKKINYALKNAEIVTAISDSVQSSLIGAGCDQKKIRKIPNGIDADRFAKNSLPNIRRRFNLPDDSRLLLSVGNYHPRKGQDNIIAAMPQVLSHFPKTRLIIVGSKQEPLVKKIRSLKLEKFIRLTGPIAFPFQQRKKEKNKTKAIGDELSALYQQSEIYVSASLNKEAEGLSLAVLDAMAAGVPVVATQISGSSDVVIHGRNGLLVPPSDHKALGEAIVFLLQREKTNKEMGVQGKLIAKKFNWKNIAQKYLAVYEEAISKSEAFGG